MKKKGRKIDTIEKLAILVVDGFEQVDKRFEQVDKRFDRIDHELHTMKEDIAYIKQEVKDIRERVEYLEELGARHAGFSKEIDHILDRLVRVERHPRLA